MSGITINMQEILARVQKMPEKESKEEVLKKMSSDIANIISILLKKKYVSEDIHKTLHAENIEISKSKFNKLVSWVKGKENLYTDKEKQRITKLKESRAKKKEQEEAEEKKANDLKDAEAKRIQQLETNPKPNGIKPQSQTNI